MTIWQALWQSGQVRKTVIPARGRKLVVDQREDESPFLVRKTVIPARGRKLEPAARSAIPGIESERP